MPSRAATAGARRRAVPRDVVAGVPLDVTEADFVSSRAGSPEIGGADDAADEGFAETLAFAFMLRLLARRSTHGLMRDAYDSLLAPRPPLLLDLVEVKQTLQAARRIMSSVSRISNAGLATPEEREERVRRTVRTLLQVGPRSAKVRA